MKTLIAATILCVTLLTFQAALSQAPKPSTSDAAAEVAAAT